MDKSTKTALFLMLLKVGGNKSVDVRFWVRGTLYYTANVDPGESVAAPPDPSLPSGNAFVGWYTEQNGGEEVTFPLVPAEDGLIPVYARFENDILDASLDVNVESHGIGLEATYPDGYDGSYFELSEGGELVGVTPDGTVAPEYELDGNELSVTV